MNFDIRKALAVVVDVVVDGFCLLLKLDKLHHDLAMLPLVSSKRLHYNWSKFELCWISCITISQCQRERLEYLKEVIAFSKYNILNIIHSNSM